MLLSTLVYYSVHLQLSLMWVIVWKEAPVCESALMLLKGPKQKGECCDCLFPHYRVVSFLGNTYTLLASERYAYTPHYSCCYVSCKEESRLCLWQLPLLRQWENQSIFSHTSSLTVAVNGEATATFYKVWLSTGNEISPQKNPGEEFGMQNQALLPDAL